jgi:hypothetical protein
VRALAAGRATKPARHVLPTGGPTLWSFETEIGGHDNLGMNKPLLSVVFLAASSFLLSAQDKPRVFVQGKGSQDLTSSGSEASGKHFGAWGSRSTADSHDESMEVTKDLQKNCSSVIVTLNQSNADYTVMLNRESKKNRGLLRSNSQLEVANRAGDVLGTNATHTVGNAAKDACQMIASDWQAHPHAGPEPAPNTAVLKPADSSADASQAPAAAQLVTVSAQGAERQATATNSDSAKPAESLGDAARRAKQHAECLDLAKDNPSIVCK